MRISQAGIIILIVITVLLGTNCSIYNKVIARKNLVDGAGAFNGRKFDEAEKLFRNASERAPDGSPEQKTALLFLARTLHSEYAANRVEKTKAEQAIEVYQKVLAVSPADNSSFKAVASLYDNLEKKDEWRKWVTDRSENASIPNEQRAEAYTSLASKENTCANDITELPEVKKTVQKDGKPTFAFSKPSKPEDLETLKGCVQKGMDLVSKAMALETDRIKSAKTIDIKSLTDSELKEFSDFVKPFESTRSFYASLLNQSARLAEMEQRTADKDKFKQQVDEAKKGFTELADIDRKIKDETEARAKAKEEESNSNPDANANSNTKANTN